jgi:HlyD family secretion protein
MTKKLILIVIAVAVIGASVWGFTKYRGGDKKPEIVTATVTRGDVVEAVGATGTLEAVTTVQVGTQVSGTVQALYADFNTIVHKGQVIARLDPSLIQTQIEQQRANLVRAEADLERLRVSLADANVKLKRATDLAGRGLIPQTELEAAQVAVQSNEAQLRSSQAGVTQARANLNQQQVNLDHTVITAPIDGIVISRNVDEGQTVAASMNAPVLYLLAADLTKMKVSANIDEADVGKIRPGQRVTFRVDAYAADEFEGAVTQVRLNPVTVQNVVTYSTVIEVPNPDYRLKPGMTANVNIEIARRDNVLRVPAGALRFRPTNDTFAALGQAVPPEMAGGGRGRGAQNAAATPQSGQPAAPAAPAPAPGAAQAPAGQNAQGQTAEQRGGGDAAGSSRRGGRGGDPNMTPEERQRRMQERMASMTPAEREAFQQRMAQRGGRGQGAGNAQGAANAPRTAVTSGAQSVDALFAPLRTTITPGRVWVVSGETAAPQLKSLRVRTGISDGQWTELVEGELTEGQVLVTGVILPDAAAQVPGTSAGNPLMGPQRGGRTGGRGR